MALRIDDIPRRFLWHSTKANQGMVVSFILISYFTRIVASSPTVSSRDDERAQVWGSSEDEVRRNSYSLDSGASSTDSPPHRILLYFLVGSVFFGSLVLISENLAPLKRFFVPNSRHDVYDESSPFLTGESGEGWLEKEKEVTQSPVQKQRVWGMRWEDWSSVAGVAGNRRSARGRGRILGGKSRMLLSLAFVASVVLGRIALDGFRVPLGFLALLDVLFMTLALALRTLIRSRTYSAPLITCTLLAAGITLVLQDLPITIQPYTTTTLQQQVQPLLFSSLSSLLGLFVKFSIIREICRSNSEPQHDIPRAGWELFSGSGILAGVFAAIGWVLGDRLLDSAQSEGRSIGRLVLGGGGRAASSESGGATFEVGGWGASSSLRTILTHSTTTVFQLTSFVLLLHLSTITSPSSAGVALALGSLALCLLSISNLTEDGDGLGGPVGQLRTWIGLGLVVLAVTGSRYRVWFVGGESGGGRGVGGSGGGGRSRISKIRVRVASWDVTVGDMMEGPPISRDHRPSNVPFLAPFSSTSSPSSRSRRSSHSTVSIVRMAFFVSLVFSGTVSEGGEGTSWGEGSSRMDVQGDRLALGGGNVEQSVFSSPRIPRATLGKDITFPQFLEHHFPLRSAVTDQMQADSGLRSNPSPSTHSIPGPESDPQRPHIWLTISDLAYAKALSTHLHMFVDRVNRERLRPGPGPDDDGGGESGEVIPVRPRVEVVTLCMTEECIAFCEEMGWYGFGGYMWNKPDILLTYTWPKLAGLIDLLETGRDAWFVDSDVVFREDPLPYMSPLEEYDIQIQEDNIYTGELNTGWFHMRSKPAVIDLWRGVLAMDLKEVSRDQKNFNALVGSSLGRASPTGPTGEFVSDKGVRVKVLPYDRFWPFHFDFGLPSEEQSKSIFLHLTCLADPRERLYVACSRGFCQDVDTYYSSPPPMLATSDITGTASDLVAVMRILLAVSHYTGRTLVAPSDFTIDLQEQSDTGGGQVIHRKFWETFSIFMLSNQLPSIRILEHNYVSNAAPYLDGQRTADDLQRGEEIDMRTVWNFPELIERLTSSSLVKPNTIRLINWNLTSHYKSWRLPKRLDKVSPCGELEVDPQCGQVCRWNPVFDEWMALGDVGLEWEDWRDLGVEPKPVGWTGIVDN